MKKVFINYSWKHDTENAEKIYDALTLVHNKFDVWMDKKSLEKGLLWRPAIRKAIRETDYFIAILSSKSVNKRGVANREIYEAIEVLKEFPPNQVYLLPTRVEECTSPFEDLIDLNYINLFPKWNDGIKQLVNALKSSSTKVEERKSKNKTTKNKYHYKIGLVNLDFKVGNFDQIIKQLNQIQSYFQFTLPSMNPLQGQIQKIDGFKNFNVSKVSKKYINENKHIDTDFIACITKYPLAFDEGNYIEYNYFSGESDHDERFIFVSVDQLNKFCKKAEILFEEGMVYMLVSQLISYFADTNFHNKTKGCALDFCETRSDIIKGFRKRKLCKKCSKKLPEGELKKAVLSLLNWEYDKNLFKH